MKLKIGKYILEVHVYKDALSMQRDMAKKVIELYDSRFNDSNVRNLFGDSGVKIGRIKAVRALYNFGLKESKDWVEAAFKDGGMGEPK